MYTDLYEKLKETARKGGIVHYSDIAPLVKLDMANPADRNEIGKILGDISLEEHEEGRPLLSVVVVSKSSGMPGQGFFDLAKELGLYDGKAHDKFFYQELRKVHEF